jgi:hypothetical protein
MMSKNFFLAKLLLFSYNDSPLRVKVLKSLLVRHNLPPRDFQETGREKMINIAGRMKVEGLIRRERNSKRTANIGKEAV